MSWPLLSRFAHLASLAPVALCDLPTPVEPLPKQGPLCWVKRDDISAHPYGGNKLRKLEWVLGEIRQRPIKRVVTLGATGTNAGLATALLCEQEQLGCDIFTFPQPDSPVVHQNRQRIQRAGAQLHDRNSLLRAALGWYLHPGRLRGDHYFLYAGCSNPIASLGYANAMLELQQQIDDSLCPAPADIVVAAGSGATVAGLLVGNQLSGLNARIHAVQVAQDHLGPFSVCNARLVIRMARQCWQQLGLPREQFDSRFLQWHDDYLGTGYGHPTAASIQAVNAAAHSGLTLENTYTGKAFAAFLALANTAVQPCLFWNTFNSHPQ
ncbi:MAG: pyridoxal-phosphate dependent enzyme [Alloalcanivorax sp.]|jgi:D-cysteine desulfhydrase